MTTIRLWDSYENFAGTAGALRRDDVDRACLHILPTTDGDGQLLAEYALTDPEWIRWQAVVAAAPAMLATLEQAVDAWSEEYEAWEKGESGYISGSDLLEWFSEWRLHAKADIAAAMGEAPVPAPVAEPSPCEGISLPIEKSLVLCTSHVSRATADLLEMQTDDVPVVHDKSGYGWMVYVSEDKLSWPHTCPEDLRKLLEVAHGAGCVWIMLDRDADEIDGLPTFDW